MRPSFRRREKLCPVIFSGTPMLADFWGRISKWISGFLVQLAKTAWKIFGGAKLIRNSGTRLLAMNMQTVRPARRDHAHRLLMMMAATPTTASAARCLAAIATGALAECIVCKDVHQKLTSHRWELDAPIASAGFVRKIAVQERTVQSHFVVRENNPELHLSQQPSPHALLITAGQVHVHFAQTPHTLHTIPANRAVSALALSPVTFPGAETLWFSGICRIYG